MKRSEIKSYLSDRQYSYTLPEDEYEQDDNVDYDILYSNNSL